MRDGIIAAGAKKARISVLVAGAVVEDTPLISSRPKTVNLPDMFVMHKILSSEYQRYMSMEKPHTRLDLKPSADFSDENYIVVT